MFIIRRIVPNASLHLRTFSSLTEAQIAKARSLREPNVQPKKKLPLYDGALNIRLQNHDYVPLEKYQSYVHRKAKEFGFNIVLDYPVASQTQKVQVFAKNSSEVVSEINLTLYDRWIRIDNVTALFFPIFLTLIQSHAPIGTIVTVKAHEKEDEEYRYIPDVQLKAKIEEMKSLDDPETRKILGWE